MPGNAEEYLLEYADDKKCVDWLKKVIKVFLADKKDDYLEALAKELIGICACTLEEMSTAIVDAENTEIVLTKLKHISGVNALANDQVIKFSQDVNVIYGLNGTGKSSYFRILNEMAGGKRETPILSNIYEETYQNISVNLNYTINGRDKNIDWNGAVRGLQDLSSIRVFDSGYTENFLKKHESDELVVKPYGLFLFADLDSFLSDIAEKANELVVDEEKKIPVINWENVLAESQATLDKEVYADSDISTINSILDSLDDVVISNNISEANENKIKLQTENPSDKLQLENSKKAAYATLLKRLRQIDDEIEAFSNTIKYDIDEYIECKKKSDDFLKQIEVLKKIPGTDSDEWKKFIEAGKSYAESSEISDVCPYCHRPYDESAMKIVKAYAIFIGNDAEQKLKKQENKLVKQREKTLQWNVITSTDNTLIDSTVLKLIKARNTSIATFKSNLLNAIDGRKKPEGTIGKSLEIQNRINEEMKKVEASIALLTEDVNKKSEELRKCEENITKLISYKSIAVQKEKIREMVNLRNKIDSYNKNKGLITKCKKNMTRLSQKAHNELLTVQLQEKFSEILQRMTQRRLEVVLSVKKEQTELSIKNNKKVSNILSEGEQKATAISLFLAEINVSGNKSTIIFDDPVNSLDHKIIAAFTDEIMNLDNQIVVFTHNKLFLDCIETIPKGHICKGIDSACSKTRGKHIFLYETSSEGKSRKGVVFERRKRDSDYYLSKAENYLSTSPFTEAEATCSCIREAVENIIDEIVFNGLAPNKYSNKNGRINWDELKKLNPDPNIIDKIHTIHGRCSGGELHSGTEREENPVDAEELATMCSDLRSIQCQAV